MYYHSPNQLPEFFRILMKAPEATALLNGSPDHPAINGRASFYETPKGVLVFAEVAGLPYSTTGCPADNIFGFHIHEGSACTGNEKDPFADAKMHLNPQDCPHPAHMGDLPPLFSNQGYAFSIVLTNRFKIEDIVIRTVIIHRMPDDFSTQPSGNSGSKIACGVINRFPPMKI